MSLKDRIEGNELDLSLNQLTDVPVKELAHTYKATHLDLSCNLLQSLPHDFASLKHLIKLDLSRNQLIELPQNFGNLINLQFLDLDKNKLKTVPTSFCRLKSLRWLDLKDNPLEPKLKAVAGDCLDEKQCQACAKKVVALMQSIESDMEREKQKMLKKMKDEEIRQKIKAEKELEEQRKLKKMEKERRKAASKARNQEEILQDKNILEEDSEFYHEIKTDEAVSVQPKHGLHWSIWLLLLFIGVVSAIYFTSSLKNMQIQDISLFDVKVAVKDFSMKIYNFVLYYWNELLSYDISCLIKKYSIRLGDISMKLWNSIFVPLFCKLKVSVLQIVHYTMICVSNLASNIEAYLSVYF